MRIHTVAVLNTILFKHNSVLNSFWVGVDFRLLVHIHTRNGCYVGHFGFHLWSQNEEAGVHKLHVAPNRCWRNFATVKTKLAPLELTCDLRVQDKIRFLDICFSFHPDHICRSLGPISRCCPFKTRWKRYCELARQECSEELLRARNGLKHCKADGLLGRSRLPNAYHGIGGWVHTLEATHERACWCATADGKKAGGGDPVPASHVP